MLNPGTYLQDRYEILGRIGSGGMSVVYKAKCHTLDRLVAIKVLKEEFASDENFVSKFKMEAQAAARLSHPNIVNVYDVVDEGDLHYIVMELIEGITLKNYIEKKGFLENKEAIGIAIQVAQGIAAAHEQHIIHRDIKPQNMIISKDGTVKVADFGIARAVSSQTMNATAVGSVHYISPEQAKGGYCDAKNLYEYWGDMLYCSVIDNSRIIINLASKEYSKSIEKYLTLRDKYITIVFCELSGDKLVTKGTYAKMARGEMVRFMAENSIENPEDIKKFDRLGYAFRHDLSSDTEYIFERRIEITSY